MIKRTTKLRLRRTFKRKQKKVESAGVNAEASIEQHFFRRISRLTRVRRFVFSWLILMILLGLGSLIQLRSLNGYYQELKPTEGGVYTEGIVGVFTNANPIYASGSADSAAAELVFSSLLHYNDQNELVNDLAEEVDTNKRGDQYTVRLRKDVKWHDGTPLTSKDVLFTYRTIQNPDARSPLFLSWRDVKLSAPDDYTIVFDLPNAFSAFPQSLTNGIVPEHKLADIPVDQMRGSRFNTVDPVGSGPFEWELVEVVGLQQNAREERISLTPNENYHKGSPKLQRFIVRTFRTEELMMDAYNRGKLNAMVGFNGSVKEIEEIEGAKEMNIPLAGEVMAFFNTSDFPLNQKAVRQALVSSVNTREAVKVLGYPVVLASGPLIPSQNGYDEKLTQLAYNPQQAVQRLEKDGWELNQEGVREKNGAELSFSLTAQETDDYAAISNYLQKSWEDIGVEVDLQLQTDSEIQGSVARHNYQALLYGIGVGSDPDVFAFWHSSQASTRTAGLNLSEYKNDEVDDALEEGRIRLGDEAQAEKYQDFLKQWRADAPALALYQPRFLYVTRGDLFNFEPNLLGTPTDRFWNVEDWMIRKELQVI